MENEIQTSALDPGSFYRIKNNSKKTIHLTLAENQPFLKLDPHEATSIEGRDILRNKWLHDQIASFEGQGMLAILPLGLSVGSSHIVHNQTARRIGIRHYSYNEDLILPPFGSRELKDEFLRGYDYLPWARQSLVTVESAEQQKQNDTVIAGISILVALFVVFLMVSVPLKIFVPYAITWPAIGLGSAIFVIVLLASIFIATRVTNVGDMGETLGNWLKLTPGFVLILLTGVALPFCAVFFFGEGQQIFNLANRNLATLGRLMQITFISVAAMLPAMLYFLFGRLQIEKQRNNFFREAMQLDPNVQSFSEAASKYDSLLDSVFGNGNSPFAILLLVITTAMLVMGWVIALDPVGPTANLTSLISFFIPRPNTFTLGFLGTYFFAINMVFRRYVRSDLTPKTYAYIIVRMMITLVLVWTVSNLPQFSPGAGDGLSVAAGSSLVNTGLLAVAFIIGVFPETGLAIITDFVRGVTKNVFKGGKEDPFPLSDLEGMNLYDRTRLLEEGIENIENLAHHDLLELIARTRIPTARVVDMFDQSLLYIHLGIDAQPVADQTPDTNRDQGRALLALLKSYGIRTASDLVNAFDHATTNLGNLEHALGDGSETISRLRVIVDAIKGEDLLDNICNFYDLAVSTNPVTDPYLFYKVTLNKPEPLHAESVKPAGLLSNTGQIVKPAMNGVNPSPVQLEPAVVPGANGQGTTG
jgi:hypothetical protein